MTVSRPSDRSGSAGGYPFRVRSDGTIGTRALALAVALGALPAVLAWALGDGSLQASDLGLAAAVFPLALVLGRFLQALPLRSAGSPLILALAVAVLVPAAAHWRLPTTVTNDERAVLLQAEIFADGELAQPLAHRAYRDPVAHCPTHQRQVTRTSSAASVSPSTRRALPSGWRPSPRSVGRSAGASWPAP